MRYIGIRICPTRKAVRDKVDQLVKKLDSAPKRMSVEEKLSYHLDYTYYTNSFLGFSTGMRAVISPIPRPFDVSPMTNAFVHTDKGWPRINLIVQPVLDQITFYAEHIEQMHTFNTFSDASFWYTPKGGSEQVRPKLIAEYMRSINFGFPPALYRRFVYNELLDAGCDAEAVRVAIMGHQVVGDEPASRHSTFVYQKAFRILKPYIIHLLDDLHFVPIRSVLL